MRVDRTGEYESDQHISCWVCLRCISVHGRCPQAGARRIFLVPANVNMMVYLNVTNNVMYQITSWPTAQVNLATDGTTSFTGGSIAPNGKLYLTPNTASCIVVIDTTSASFPSAALCTWPTANSFNKANIQFGAIGVGPTNVYFFPTTGSLNLMVRLPSPLEPCRPA